jgi:hypothetical protein
VAAVLGLALLPAVAARAGFPASQIERDQVELSTVPVARGVLLPKGLDDQMKATGARLAVESEAGTLYLATPEAGFYYLVAGIENPTPYDYPLATALGRDGEDELIEAVTSGRLETVCMRLAGYGSLVPRRFVRTVTSTMKRSETIGPCNLYRQRR